MFKYFFLRACLIILTSSMAFQSSAKNNQPIVSRVDPPNWWIGMAEQTVLLTFYGLNIQDYALDLHESATKIEKIILPKNRNYVLAEVVISPDQKAGELIFMFTGKKKKKIEVRYPLFEREEMGRTRGINSSDLIYLVFPDRFSNGNLQNDVFSGMHETSVDRNGLKSRHGGDIQGILNHLDYIEELGTTALWVNPVLENNQPKESYHGYAATDLYKVDPRFGNNETYRALSKACHARGIRMIWDVVYNHWGNENWMFKDLPDSSWVHTFKQFTRTSYRAEVLLDPYASDYDKKIMTDGWFDYHMPDLNQQNELLSGYLIQNSIWWIEYAGIDAFRIDTYAYPDQQFMKKLNESILKEYPAFVLFGETWVQGAPVQAWFTQDAYVKKDYSSSLNGVTDFQLYYAITKGINEPFGWEEGFRRIELTLSHDVLYKNPSALVTFLDNHDLSRFYSVINEDFSKYKMGIALMYTLRGIPSIYYGTEILMKNYADPDAKVREDFAGGWPDDATNKFTSTGRTEKENMAFLFCKTLGQWRKKNAWIGNSKLTQFVPENNTYVYFRHDASHMIMCVYNGNETAIEMDMSRFEECLRGKKKVKEIITETDIEIPTSMLLQPRSVMIYQFQ